MDRLLPCATAAAEYENEIKSSQGFYVTKNKGGCLFPKGVIPVEKHSPRRIQRMKRKHLDGQQRKSKECKGQYSDYQAYLHYRKAKRAAKFVLKNYTPENRRTRIGVDDLETILRLNRQWTDAGTIYYITMLTDDVYCTEFEAKVLEKCDSSGYEVFVFRRAPYFESFCKLANKDYCGVLVNDLLPWMDERYFYYKCFNAHEDILGIRIVLGRKSNGSIQAAIRFKNVEALEKFESLYQGKLMPFTTDKVYDMVKNICHIGDIRG